MLYYIQDNAKTCPHGQRVFTSYSRGMLNYNVMYSQSPWQAYQLSVTPRRFQRRVRAKKKAQETGSVRGKERGTVQVNLQEAAAVSPLQDMGPFSSLTDFCAHTLSSRTPSIVGG